MPEEENPREGVPPTTGIVGEIAPTTRIGAYQILESIGEGGFGVVYMAEQREPVRRRVALKVLKAGMDTAEVISRFEGERQALAMMDHPNIAKVLDAGVTREGRPFFAMEFVPGRPITEYCDAARMPTRERLRLMVETCRAVQHAHQRGIIHRDLKPSNILVCEVDGKPVPKVIDFGIAKATTQQLSAATVYTQAGRMMGTPEYMSPEQTGMGGLDIDTRTDVYSLGVVLYEVITGVLPFESADLRSAGYIDIQRIIREVEPMVPSARLSRIGSGMPTIVATVGGSNGEASPDRLARVRDTDFSSLRRMVRGELDWITMKALEKERTRRYESASALAADIERFLANEPVQASPPSATYRARKFVRRNRLGVAFGLTTVALLSIGVVRTIMYARYEAQQRREIEAREKDLLQVTQFQAAMLGGIDPESAGQKLISRLSRDLADQGASLAGVNSTDVALDFIDQTILAPAKGAIDEQFAEQPTIDATLRQSLAETYVRLGLVEKALPLLERTLQIREKELGPNHPDTITAVGNVGYILQALGRLEEAGPYFEGAVGRMEKLRGANHPELAAHLNNLAMLRVDQGKPAEGRPLYERAIAIQTLAKGTDDPDTLLYENNLGGALEAAGDNAAAEVHYRRSLEGTLRTIGPDSIDALTGMNNLAGVLESQGKRAEAEEMYRRSLEGRKKLLGTGHPSTLLAVNNLGFLLTRTDRAAEAEKVLAEGLAAARSSLGEAHPRTLTLRHNHAEAIRKGGRFAEAESEFRATFEAREKVLGSAHPDTITTRVSLALSIRDQGRLAEAASQIEEAMKVAATLDQSVGVVGATRTALLETYELLAAKEPEAGWSEKATALKLGNP
jgi:non-specific serine/threonine protein kinase/serine/threonine-protein kinase